MPDNMLQKEEEQFGELAFSAITGFKQSIVQMRKHYMTAAEYIHAIIENKYWKAEAETLDEFLAASDIDIKKTTAYNMHKNYEHFILQWNCDQQLLAEVGATKLTLLLEQGEVDEHSVHDRLLDVRDISKRQLRDEMLPENESQGHDTPYVQIVMSGGEYKLIVFDPPPEGVQSGVYPLGKREQSAGDYTILAKLRGRTND